MKTKEITRLIAIAFSMGASLYSSSGLAAAIISNGTVQMGVRDLGDLNVGGGSPSNGDGTTIVGLRSVVTNSDSTSPGCTCEGWGAGIVGLGGASNISGFANSAVGTSGVSLVSFSSTASTAVSVVNVLGPTGAPALQVTHNYHPIAGTPFLYEVDVAIKNLTGQALSAGQLVYRRVMDWDIPTPGRESVSIQGVPALLGLANGNNVRRTDNNGFNSGDPFSFTPFGLTNINFTNAHGDIGALFDFEFEALADGASRTFATFYGVAPSKADADLARSMVNGNPADVEIGLYSYGSCASGSFSTGGQPSFNCNETTGAPDTFIFGFGAVGGLLPPPPPPPPPGVPEPGSLALLGLGLATLTAMRRRWV